MVKRLVAIVCVCVSGLVMAYAQGGFTGQTQGGAAVGGPRVASGVIKVSEVKNYPDDSWVTLSGNILRSIGKEKYMFSDGSGEIVIEIDNDEWRGLTVNEKDRVNIVGEVEVKRNGAIEIDVKAITKAN